MHDQKGFMGCGNLVIIFWLLFMLAFAGLIMLNKNLFHVPPVKYVLTSPVAARRCRQKLEIFKNNSYIKSLLLNELEVNSVLKDEFAHGQYRPIMSVTVKMDQGKLKIECMVIFRDLFPREIREKLLSESKRKGKKKPPRRVVVNLSCRPVIEEGGNLFVNPTELVIGRQNIPLFMIKIITAVKPDWFNYRVSEEISDINMYEQELEIVKRGVTS